MDIAPFIKVVQELGFPVAVGVYFFVKDWTFTKKQIELQTQVVVALNRLAPILENLTRK
jgi:hypothetical protein